MQVQRAVYPVPLFADRDSMERIVTSCGGTLHAFETGAEMLVDFPNAAGVQVLTDNLSYGPSSSFTTCTTFGEEVRP